MRGWGKVSRALARLYNIHPARSQLIYYDHGDEMLSGMCGRDYGQRSADSLGCITHVTGRSLA